MFHRKPSKRASCFVSCLLAARDTFSDLFQFVLHCCKFIEHLLNNSIVFVYNYWASSSDDAPVTKLSTGDGGFVVSFSQRKRV